MADATLSRLKAGDFELVVDAAHRASDKACFSQPIAGGRSYRIGRSADKTHRTKYLSDAPFRNSHIL
jgi:hypothetical protein